jgi:hypothetical protein
VRQRGVDRAQDRGHREQRADDAEAERDRAALDELADEPGLLTGRGRQDGPDDLAELALGAVLAVDEAEDTDDEREERDEREEDLVGDRAGEERSIVGEEPARDLSRRYEDVVSAFDDPLFASAAGFASAAFASAAFGLASLGLPSAFASGAESFAASFCTGRLSVLYQPPPLNTMAGVAISLRGRLPQLGHFSSVSSVYDWTAENTCPQ